MGVSNPGEEHSTLTILKVERDSKLGNIVHIAIDGVKIKTSGGDQERLPHVPIAMEALDKSVTKLLVADVPIPDFEAGYAQ